MERKITLWLLGLMLTLSAFQMRGQGSLADIIKANPNIDYYIKIEILNSNSQYESIGYLHKDDDHLKVENVKEESAIWRVISSVDGSANSYVIVQGTDTLAFVPPTTVTDTIATLVNSGRLNRWDAIVFNYGERNGFRSSYMDESVSVHTFNLRITDDDVVMLTAENSAIYNVIYFTLERVIDAPKPNSIYKILIDTIDVLNIAPTDTILLGIDTIQLPSPPHRIDSLVTSNAINDSDTAFFWKFVNDTVVHDSTYYKIYNALTDSILAFDVPRDTASNQFVDTVAYMQQTGTLNRWLIPCFRDQGGKNTFIVRDPQSKTDFFLSLKPSGELMLVSDTTQHKYLTFKFIEQGFVPEPPDIGDRKKVFRVQYSGLGTHDQQYMGANLQGDTVWSQDVYGRDTVYAHIPDFQFIISPNNKYELINRLDSTIRTGILTAVIDTFVNPHQPLNHHFTNGIDTFVITAIEYGDIDNLKKDVQLGFKAFQTSQLATDAVIFSRYSADTLGGRNLGYNVEDSTFSLMMETDSVRFILTPATKSSRGAVAVANYIKQLQREAYLFSVVEDEALHLSKGDTLLSVGQPGAVLSDNNDAVAFFLKEDTARGTYYFVDTIVGNKLLIDTLSKQLYFAPADTTATHSFTLILRPKLVLEPDDNTYLTELPNGSGKYEIAYLRNTTNDDWRWLTKNSYDRAVLRKEGESMLRAGSFTPADFSLWVDTARGTSFNPVKPSFYIVKDASIAETNPITITGYFLHVMDSTSLPVHDDDVIVVDDIEYNRLNFVKAKKIEPNGLLLETGEPLTLRDSVGYAGKNESAINEYRFFLQETGEFTPDGKGDKLYYIVTEAGYGSPEGNRGYLSIKKDDYNDDTLYVGPRNTNACKITLKAVSTVTANKVVTIPQVKEEEVSHDIAVIGGKGSISINNAKGQQATVYNIVGVKVANKELTTDNETLIAPRGISIVRVGTRTQKVVVL
ncbi:MAG: DUF6383 domain-containing protein [Tannerella sp.]|jgi:hypothetical protein|nr:DUF6383 domain-containing protein [Tannerella sp.]